jgi:hypothetical protein
MERDVIERVPALDGAHGRMLFSNRSLDRALPARELEDESFENLRLGTRGRAATHFRPARLKKEAGENWDK